MAVSGVAKLHAVIGGFHLGVAPPDYVEHTIAELKALDPDVVLPMHCSGRAFLAGMAREMAGASGAVEHRQPVHLWRLNPPGADGPPGSASV